MITTENQTLESLLAELSAEPPARMEKRVSSAFDGIAAPYQNRVVLFGCGQLGKMTVPGLRNVGMEPLAFCDNNSRLWGTRIEDIPVLAPEEAASRYRDSAAFVVTIYNSTPAREQLRKLGCSRVVPYPMLFWKHWRFMPREDRLELPHRILEHTDDILAGYELLADDASREEFRAQIRWRCLLDYGCLPRPRDPREIYFTPGLFRLSDDEVLVDCGAFDGDSVRDFLTRTGGRFRHIYALEPDAANIDALERYCSSLAPEIAGRITILPYAVGATNGTVRFCAEGFQGSRIAEAGSVEIPCRTLDTALPENVCPTLIKMDIEGAEPQAIPGAARTISRCRPVMAVCAYHKCDHLWTLPRLLKAAAPDYRIYLRRYAEDCWETIYYGVPPERARV